MEGTREVHNSVALKLTTSSKNIARFATATKFLETKPVWELFESIDRVLGCKPTFEPTVVVDSMPSTSKADEKISKVTYPDDGDEAWLMSHAHSSPIEIYVAATPKEKSRCTKTTDISLAKNRNNASKSGIEHEVFY